MSIKWKTHVSLLFLGYYSVVALTPLENAAWRRHFVPLLSRTKKRSVHCVSNERADRSRRPCSDIDAEVVGAQGRIGSQILRLTMGPKSNKQTKVMAVPRGLCPGSLTDKQGKPIFVTTHSTSWSEIHAVTLPSRRDDLVWIGNGLLDDQLHKNATVVVVHYGILKVGQEPTTNDNSPPTVVYGRHAQATAALLQQDGIAIRVTKDWNEIRVAAARKVLWSAVLWLFCHYQPRRPFIEDNNGDASASDFHPLTTSQVHEMYSNELKLLLLELWPSFQQIFSDQLEPALTDNEKLEETLSYMRQYSDSMPGAVPSFNLAKSEFHERNGIFLKSREVQPFHYHLLETVLGRNQLDTLLEKRATLSPPPRNSNLKIVPLPDTSLFVYGRPRPPSEPKARPPENRSIVVVGGGFLGSAIAMNLARASAGSTITVVDAQQSNSSWPLGVATKSSWAWLNGNQKSPPLSYQWLNQLGIIVWRRDPVLESLPSWKGSLVQCREHLPDTMTFLAGYPTEGPLSREQILQLEPHCAFRSNQTISTSNDIYPTYFFPDEGCVDPMDAVRTMREFAQSRESCVSFLFGHKVVETIHDENGVVSGLACQKTGHPDEKSVAEVEPFLLPADVVIFAGGVASKEVLMGAIPLNHSPGTIVLSTPKTQGSNRDQTLLSRILVDAVHESHILQRRDGTFAVGGGYLQVGGASAAQNNPATKEEANEDAMMSMAEQYVAPSIVEQLNFDFERSTHESVRPMPKDGFPSVGFLPGGNRLLYSVVAHSGVTLGPLIAQLVTAEIQFDLDLVLLEEYRPHRFFQ